MPDLEDGESIEVQGSGSNRYVLRNIGEVYSCTCPAWRNQSLAIDRRTCKHLKALRGEAAEIERLGGAVAPGASTKAQTSPSTGAAKSASPDQEGPPILLANPWDNAQDLSGWWMSEKLDGVRAYWDGKVFLSRLGNRYHAPDWFTAGLPDFPLDGELWGGRKRFQRTISVVRRQDKSDDWKEIAFLVFDAPAMDAPFEDRLAVVKTALEPGSGAKLPYARYHDHAPCKGLPHLREELARVEGLGGEGLMMRKPGSRYEVGRSSSLLKVKSFFDAEALVKEHLAGTGKHKGRLGALLVELPDGTKFSIGTGFSDKERESPPKVGSIVTFRYQELSDAGVPRFPSYVCVRDDVKWPPDNALVRRASEHAPTDSLGGDGASGDGAKSKGSKPSASAVSSAVGPTSAAAPVSLSAPVSMGAPVSAGTPMSAPPPTVVSPIPAGVFQEGTPRRFELQNSASTVVWEIVLKGRSISTRTGGGWSSGQSMTKELSGAEAALREAEGMVREKVRGGYREIYVG